jgi:hypothetical protein
MVAGIPLMTETQQMKKLAILLLAAGLVSACSESPLSVAGVRSQYSQDGDGPYITSAVNSGSNQVTATFAAAIGKSYNVHMSPDGGTKHITSDELVDDAGTAVFNSLPPGDYTVCVKEQGIGGPFGGCMQVTVAGEAITLQAQVIDFGPLGGKTYGDGSFTVSATGGASGSPVTFSASGACTIEGNIVTITGAGECTITADQEGGNGFSAAQPVSQSFTIAARALTIEVSPTTAIRTYGQANPTCSYSVAGTVGAENFSVSCNWDAATATTPVGSIVANGYTVTCDNGCVLGNYAFTVPTANLTIVAYNCGLAHDFIQPVGSMPVTKAPVKLGSVVPVKFMCVDTNNLPILNLTADFKAVNMSNTAVVRNVANAFRLSNALTGQYLYNLDTTSGFILNGQYGLYAYLNDGTVIDGGLFMSAK